MTMRSIQTHYKGFNFRSRLEARWAVFFDALNVKWEYETEGYEFDDGTRYLPDFYLPEVNNGLWVEIKGKAPNKEDREKLEKLVLNTRKSGTFRVGEPYINIELAEGSDGEDFNNSWIYLPIGDDDPSVGGDVPYLFCLCPWCFKVGMEYDGRGARVCGYKKHYESEHEALKAIEHLGHWRADDKCYTGNHPMIVKAANAARSARFEFGECGATT